MGPTWGPPGSCRPQIGPMLAPWTLLSGYALHGDGVAWRRFSNYTKKYVGHTGIIIELQYTSDSVFRPWPFIIDVVTEIMMIALKNQLSLGLWFLTIFDMHCRFVADEIPLCNVHIIFLFLTEIHWLCPSKNPLTFVKWPTHVREQEIQMLPLFFNFSLYTCQHFISEYHETTLFSHHLLNLRYFLLKLYI